MTQYRHEDDGDEYEDGYDEYYDDYYLDDDYDEDEKDLENWKKGPLNFAWDNERKIWTSEEDRPVPSPDPYPIYPSSTLVFDVERQLLNGLPVSCASIEQSVNMHDIFEIGRLGSYQVPERRTTEGHMTVLGTLPTNPDEMRAIAYIGPNYSMRFLINAFEWSVSGFNDGMVTELSFTG